MAPKFQVDYSAYLLFALGLLILPFSWLMGAVAAAGIHEICHFFVAKCLNVSCNGFRIGAGGMTMTMGYMTERDEFWIALAGPVGSLSLLLFHKIFPEIAVCGLVQGLYNLLPVYPLDGGRLLRCILKGRKCAYRKIETGTLLLTLLAVIYIGIRDSLGLAPVLLWVLGFSKAIHGKFPCKDG